MNLNGKVCVVTGGARGIGRQIVESFAAAGAKSVIALDMNFDGFEEISSKYTNVKSRVLNVTSSDDVKSVCAGILNEEGSVEVLVNNAGITRDNLIQKMSDDDWDAVINVNLKGVFLITRELAPGMIEKNNGSIINMASIVGVVGNVGQSNYAATKGGVITLTKTWAKEFARKGAQVRVNAIAPGFIRTPMTEKMPEKILDLMVGKTPLSRMGEAEDVANAALFLASDKASFVTAQTLGVDGGLVL